MSQNAKIGLGLVAIVILALIVFWYPSYKIQNIQNDQKAKLILDDKVYKLNKLVLAHECSAVLEEAATYLQVNSDAEQIWNVLGVCQFELGKFKDAENTFQKVLSLNPNNDGAQSYLKVLNPAEDTKAKLANQAKYEEATGNIVKYYSPSSPPGFPAGFPSSKTEQVMDSHVETQKGDVKENANHTYVVFIYTTKETQQSLADKFSNYLNNDSYSLQMPKDESGKYVVLLAKKDPNINFTITISNNENEAERFVSINYSTIEPVAQKIKS